MFKQRILLILLFVACMGSIPARAQITITTKYENSGQLKEKYQARIDGRDTIKDGLFIYFHPNGEKMQAGLFKNNQLDSIWTLYDQQGKIEAKISYKKNRKDGFFAYFYTDGTVRQTGKHQNGLLQGELKTYDEQGDLTYIAHYQKGLQHGLTKQFQKGGLIGEVQNFTNGIPDGLYEKYYDDGSLNYRGEKRGNNFVDTLWVYYKSGNLKRLCYYNDKGHLHGEYKAFHENGQLHIECNYVDGEIQGDYLSCFMNGSVAEKGVYQNHKRIGHWETFYPDQSLYIEGSYDDQGYYEGEWLIYFANGLLKQKGVYRQGKSQGLWSFYYINGMIKQRGHFVDDQKEGIWFEYEQDQSEAIAVFYQHGKRHGLAWLFIAGTDEPEKYLFKEGLPVDEEAVEAKLKFEEAKD